MYTVLFFFLVTNTLQVAKLGLKPVGVSSRNSQRYLTNLLLRVLDVSPHRRRHGHAAKRVG